MGSKCLASLGCGEPVPFEPDRVLLGQVWLSAGADVTIASGQSSVWRMRLGKVDSIAGLFFLLGLSLCKELHTLYTGCQHPTLFVAAHWATRFSITFVKLHCSSLQMISLLSLHLYTKLSHALILQAGSDDALHLFELLLDPKCKRH